MKFSPRLRALFDECPSGEPIYDLCCDHGYLGVYAYATQRFPEVVFVDQVEHSMKSLAENFDRFVKDENNPTQVRFITANAARLSTPLYGTVVIAGVGGANIMRILQALIHSTQLLANTLVLAPHKHRELFELPELFDYHHFKTKEVNEKGIIRPIFVFKK